MNKNKNFLHALQNSLNGLKVGFKSERNIKIDIVLAFITIVMSLVFKISTYEFIFVIYSVGLVFVCEYFNTVIEYLIDFLHGTEFNQSVKIIKDLSSAAVLISAINSLIIGIIIFAPKILSVLFNLR